MSQWFVALFLSLALHLAVEETPEPQQTSVLPAGMSAAVSEEFRRLAGQHSKSPLTREQIDRRFAEQSVFKGTFLESSSRAERKDLLDIAKAGLVGEADRDVKSVAVLP